RSGSLTGMAGVSWPESFVPITASTIKYRDGIADGHDGRFVRGAPRVALRPRRGRATRPATAAGAAPPGRLRCLLGGRAVAAQDDRAPARAAGRVHTRPRPVGRAGRARTDPAS